MCKIKTDLFSRIVIYDVIWCSNFIEKLLPFIYWQSGHILQIGSISKFEDMVEDILQETGDEDNVEIKYK